MAGLLMERAGTKSSPGQIVMDEGSRPGEHELGLLVSSRSHDQGINARLKTVWTQLTNPPPPSWCAAQGIP